MRMPFKGLWLSADGIPYVYLDENCKGKKYKHKKQGKIRKCYVCGEYNFILVLQCRNIYGTYICKSCMKGKYNPFWNNGEILDGEGYVRVRVINNNKKTIKKYVREHRLVMEKHLERKLTNREVVHHIDGNRKNNKIDNLLLLDSRDHMRLHDKTRKRNKKGQFA